MKKAVSCKSQFFLIFESYNKTLKVSKMNNRTFEIKNRPKQTICNILLSLIRIEDGKFFSGKIVQIVISTLQKSNFYISLSRLTEQ